MTPEEQALRDDADSASLEELEAAEAILERPKRKASDFWRTPREPVDRAPFSKAAFSYLHGIFGFEVDAAAEKADACLPVWFGPDSPVELFDSLNATPEEWLKHGSRFFLNPPLSQKAGPLEKWMAKAFSVAEAGPALVVALVPATPSTRWFQTYGTKAARFFSGSRVKYVPPPDLDTQAPGARHDSMVLVFAGNLSRYGVWL